MATGWGRLTWGQAQWNEDNALATGWGAKSWGDGEWGTLADETVTLTGFSITSTLNDSVVGRSKSRNCESVIFEVATKKITKINTISISGVISMLGFLFDASANFI